MSQTITQIIDDLPEKSVTTYVLNALDFVVPGQWENIVGFENTIRKVTGESDPELIRAVAKRANELYNDPNQGYQRAMWLYQAVDKTDVALGAAAFANKVGDRIGFLSFLTRLTPKADTVQTIDLSLKLVVEVVAFCDIRGIPGDSLGDFTKSLTSYGKAELMRMAALVCLDGLLPLGPDFTQMAGSTLSKLSPAELEKNDTFKRISDYIPGADPNGKLGFINRSFEAVQSWMDGFVSARNINPQKVLSSLQRYVEIADDKLDYVGAFIDMSTDYYSHTGKQSLARHLIERSVSEI
jgi:hypothetical protein